MTLLIPFAAYLFAEHFGWSGILAAVAAGHDDELHQHREGIGPVASACA